MRGRFRNPWPGAAPHGFGEFLRWALFERPRTRRRGGQLPPFPVAPPAFRMPRAGVDEITLTWIGHSSFLLQLGGRNILLDPVWGARASPVAFAGPRRYTEPGVDFAALPPIDFVVESHDHYDHLDRGTVVRILREHRDAEWIAPLGVGAWLERRGAEVAAELDWWDEAQLDAVTVTCVPAQHFAGRWLTNRNATLWCGWVLRAAGRAVYFAGDTARHPELGAIARACGPFDAALLPVGAYEPRWFMRPVHMDPSDAVGAYRDLVASGAGAACTCVAMHWGTFRLTDEPVDEPPRRTREQWDAAGLPPDRLWVPRHGETRVL